MAFLAFLLAFGSLSAHAADGLAWQGLGVSEGWDSVEGQPRAVVPLKSTCVYRISKVEQGKATVEVQMTLRMAPQDDDQPSYLWHSGHAVVVANLDALRKGEFASEIDDQKFFTSTAQDGKLISRSSVYLEVRTHRESVMELDFDPDTLLVRKIEHRIEIVHTGARPQLERRVVCANLSF